ncbi:cysteine hydrolase family protein [Candidatus Formimonas warabiya]|uniref:Isochorismatase-like domain-containing protein n=1 Tax=Formimonas warabiya TaxID=1761012 RepID=A0A3G1KUW5_FORW1|nr:cysteine hydrolase [Candidatus Formimonas warabiya]ATW26224.1 hypothetical protein DCMF_16940 [Candidatus Formimonas warabiya]
MNFSHAALLVIDLQMVSWPNEYYGVPNMPQIVKNVQPVLTGCRNMGIPVIYTRQYHSKSGIDTSRGEPRLPEGYPYMEGSAGLEIVSAIKPAEKDIVINKHRWSAFFNTETEIILRRLGIEHLIMCGVTTDCCVMLTAYDAFYRDYLITIIEDCCGATEHALHQASIINMANWIYQSKIIKASELVKALEDKPYSVWEWQSPGAFTYTPDTMTQVFSKLK